MAQETGSNASIYEQLELFGNVFERVRADYVEAPDDKELIEAAINGMLTSLDPHSSFLSASDYEDMQTQTRGSFGGLGIEVSQEEGLVKVVSPIDDTPAAQAGQTMGFTGQSGSSSSRVASPARLPHARQRRVRYLVSRIASWNASLRRSESASASAD